MFLLQVAAQNCRRRKLGLISRLKDELDATRKTRKQLMEDRKKLTQECTDWATKVSDIKTRVLRGLGKSPRKYCLEIANQKVAIGLRCELVVKKRQMSNVRAETVISPLQMSWNEPLNTSFPQEHLNSIKVEIKEENDLNSETKNSVLRNKIDHEDTHYQMSFVNPEYIKEEEIHSLSQIKEEVID